LHQFEKYQDIVAIEIREYDCICEIEKQKLKASSKNYFISMSSHYFNKFHITPYV
jgi:hypothetical protein